MNIVLAIYIIGCILTMFALDWMEKTGALDASIDAEFHVGDGPVPKPMLTAIVTVLWPFYVPYLIGNLL